RPRARARPRDGRRDRLRHGAGGERGGGHERRGLRRPRRGDSLRQEAEALTAAQEDLAIIGSMSASPVLRRGATSLPRELLVFAAFLGLTAVMTWPWVTHLRDAVSDPGDPYISSWVMYWDFHQTFHDPL